MNNQKLKQLLGSLWDDFEENCTNIDQKYKETTQSLYDIA